MVYVGRILLSYSLRSMRYNAISISRYFGCAQCVIVGIAVPHTHSNSIYTHSTRHTPTGWLNGNWSMLHQMTRSHNKNCTENRYKNKCLRTEPVALKHLETFRRRIIFGELKKNALLNGEWVTMDEEIGLGTKMRRKKKYKSMNYLPPSWAWWMIFFLFIFVHVFGLCHLLTDDIWCIIALLDRMQWQTMDTIINSQPIPMANVWTLTGIYICMSW